MVDPVTVPVATTVVALKPDAWTDLGETPMILSATGPAVCVLDDTLPTVPLGIGHVVPAGAAAGLILHNIKTHVWAMVPDPGYVVSAIVSK